MQVTWFRNVATAMVFVAALVSGCGSDSTPTATDSIEITPDTQTIGVGATQAFKASVVKDGNDVDVTADASWSSSDESVATVDSSGVAKGVAKGTTTITAKLASGATASATLTVTDAMLKELTLSPAKKSIAVGTSQDYTLTGTYTDGASHDVSSSSGVTWTSSSESVATVDNKGSATAKSAGTTTISAKLMGITGSTTLTVTGNEVTSLAIDPSPVSLANGTSQELKVTASFSDGSSQEVTGDADWSSDDSDVATVSNDGDSKGTLSAKKSGTTNVKAAFMGMTATVAVVVTDASLTSLAITPGEPKVAKGETVDLVATGTFSDNSNQDLTSTVTWTSSDTSIATVSNAAGSKGRVNGLKTGSCKITAARNGKDTSVTVNVTDASLVSIDISSDSVTLPNGVTVHLTATGNYSDQTSKVITNDVSWHSSDTDTVDVDDSDEHKGEATGHAEGSATIMATLGSVTGTKQFTVSSAVLTGITLSPLAPSIAKGTKVSFIANGQLSDGTSTDVTSAAMWTSSNTTTATFSATAGQRNQATGKAAGTSMVTASLNGITSAPTTLTVTDATLVSIAVTPATPSIAKGMKQQFIATGTYSDNTTQPITADVTWSSSAATVTIDNSTGHEGLATGVDTGSVQIRAAKGDVQSPQVTLVVTAATLDTIVVTPGSPTIAKGNTQAFVANGTYSDGSQAVITSSVTWTSAMQSVATINASGVATGVDVGTSMIRASLSGKQSNQVVLTVSAAQLQSVQVTPLTASIANGTPQQYHANAIYSDGTHPDVTSQAVWASSDTNVAGIDSIGHAVGAAVGSTNITATFSNMTSAAATLNVTSAVLQSITVTPGSATIHLGQAQQFYADGLFSDSSHQDLTSVVTWVSDDSSVAVSNTASQSDPHGNATAVHLGSANITASYSGITSQAAVATVSAEVLTAIQITPASGSLSKGLSQNYTAQGFYSNNTSGDVTQSVTWTSSNSNVAAIDSNGHLDAVSAGMVTITAHDPVSATEATATLSVTAALVDSIQVTPIANSIAQLTKLQFTATGIYTDHTHQDLTSAVLWASDMPTAVSVSNSSGTSGIATAGTVASNATANISASYRGVTGSTTLTVTAAKLTSIVVETLTGTRPKGLTAAFTATGHFDDSTTQDLTTQVTWTSDMPGIATISNAVGSEGVASTLAAGTGVTITAGLLNSDGVLIQGTHNLDVTNAEVQSITILGGPALDQIPKGTTTQYTADGVFTDGTSGHVTSSLVWYADTSSIADLCAPLPGGAGCFAGASTGTVTITAQIVTSNGTISATKILTVTQAALVSIAVTANHSATPLPAGLTRNYVATGTYTDNSTAPITGTVIWTVDDTNVADVSNVGASAGLVTGKAVGSTNVVATSGTVHGSIALTVSAAVLQSIDISADPVSLPKGLTFRFHAFGNYSDGTQPDISTSVQWETSDHAIATISSASGTEGVAFGVDVGTVNVTATKNAIVGTVSLDVSSAVLQSIAVQYQTPQPSIALGTDAQLLAIGTYSAGPTVDITNQVDWTSSDTSKATVTLNGGLVHSLAVGTTTVTATQGAISGNLPVVVRQADLSQIQIGTVGGVSSVPNGLTAQFIATGIYTDNHSQDITNQVTWTSDMPTKASISNASPIGELTGLMVASGITITATDQGSGVTATYPFDITAAVVQSLTLSPLTPTIAKGTTKQFSVKANYSDGTQPTVTTSASWTTSMGSVALISNTAPSKGLASAVNMGTTTISVSFGGRSAMTDLMVTDATLQTITVTPATPSTPVGFIKQFTATGTYSDNTQQDLTNAPALVWSSSNETAAIISNAQGTKGLASTNTSGMSTTIKATLGANFGTTVFTVTAATLTSIDVGPTGQSLGTCGVFTPVTAMGNFSDSSSNDVTSQVTFTSDDTTVLTVANTGTSQSPVFQMKPKGMGDADVVAIDPISGVMGLVSVHVTVDCP